MYVVLGATGHIGSVISNALLAKGEKVRVVGRTAARLEPFVAKGAEAFVANVNDAPALERAFAGARAAFLLVPPDPSSPDYRAEQSRVVDATATAVRNSGLNYAVNLSSYGAQVPSGTGPIAGLHHAEQQLNLIAQLNVLHLRPGYFMENELNAIGLIQNMGIYGTALKPEVKLPMIATRDIGAHAAERLLKLDFSGKSTKELLGAGDVRVSEVAATIGAGIGKPELPCVRFPYAQVEQTLQQMGLAEKTAHAFVEMYQAINDGVVAALEPRSATNTTPTTFAQFVQEVFVPAYRGKAAGA